VGVYKVALLFDKDIFKNLVASFYFSILSIVVSAVIGLLTGRSALSAGLPFYDAALRGSIVFLVLMVGLLLAGFLISRFR